MEIVDIGEHPDFEYRSLGELMGAIVCDEVEMTIHYWCEDDFEADSNFVDDVN